MFLKNACKNIFFVIVFTPDFIYQKEIGADEEK